ncbi:MAG: DUF4369 domain-containing protein [Bacteroides sp.]|nr:DUF4369 domain-containing protein [Bacteroides sp.]
MNRILLPFLLLLLTLCSCGRKYKIEGTSSVTSLDGKMLFIKAMDHGEWVVIDSAEVVHGVFSMRGKVDTILMATLYLGDTNIMPLVLEKGSIRIHISNNELSVRGTRHNDALYDFIDKRNDMETRLYELDRKEARLLMDGGDWDTVRLQIVEETEQLVEEMNAYIKTFISDNYETILGPSVFIMLCSSLPYPVLTPQIEDILKDAPSAFSNDFMVKEYVAKAEENMKLINENRRPDLNNLTSIP